MLDVIRTSQKRKELDKLKTDGASKNINQNGKNTYRI